MDNGNTDVWDPDERQQLLEDIINEINQRPLNCLRDPAEGYTQEQELLSAGEYMKDCAVSGTTTGGFAASGISSDGIYSLADPPRIRQTL